MYVNMFVCVLNLLLSIVKTIFQDKSCGKWHNILKCNILHSVTDTMNCSVRDIRP